MPSFRHALVDLAPMDDHSLSSKVRLRAFLKALKYCRRPDLPYRLLTVLADAPELDGEDLLVILTYLEQGPITISSDVMHEALRRLVPKREERIMGGFAQPYFDKGKAEGIAEGIAEGEVRGRAKILSRLLEKRFGALPQSIQQQIAAADVVSIEAWFDRALDAADSRSVFVSN